MFDIGFFEIVFVFIIALLVVGPEKLPRLARTAGLWLGKLRGFVTSVKADIDREIASEELRKTLQRQAAVPELEELLDEVTGKPLQTGERNTPGSSAPTATADTGPVDDERKK